MKEIQQPPIELDRDNPLLASVTRLHAEWLKAVGPQLGLDVETMIRGEILGSIIKDDVTAFGFVYQPGLVRAKKAFLLDRLTWEIGAPETPDEIRVELQATLEEVSGLDWSSFEQYEKARKRWRQTKEFVQRKIEENPAYKRAMKYSHEASKIWSPYWQEFLGNI